MKTVSLSFLATDVLSGNLSETSTMVLSNTAKNILSRSIGSTTIKQNITRAFEEIPGPRPSLPYIGTGWIYFRWVGNYQLEKLHEANLDKYQRYGPIVKEEYQQGVTTINLYDPADFERVFQAEKKTTCPVRPVSEFIRNHRQSDPARYPNVGLANMLGEEWAAHRSKLTPTFMRMGLAEKQIDGQNVVGDSMVKYIMNMETVRNNNNLTNSGYRLVADVQDLFYRFTIESIMQMSIGQTLGCFESLNFVTGKDKPINDGSRLVGAAKMFFDAQHKLYYGAPTWKTRETDPYRKLKESQNKIHDIISNYVNPALKTVKINSSLQTKTQSLNQDSILETLCNTSDYSDQEIKSTITDFIGGGIFTAANALTIILFHLACNQQIQERLYDEIRGLVDGKQEKNFISCARLEKLKLLKSCIKESSRLAPTVPGIARNLTEDLVLSNYNVPKGTLVFCNSMITCRLEKYFSEPDRYIPDRWMDVKKRRKEIHPYALLPFGFGRRSCIGRDFAKLEMNIAVAKLISKFRIELVDEKDIHLGLKYAFIVIPEKPVRLKFFPR